MSALISLFLPIMGCFAALLAIVWWQLRNARQLKQENEVLMQQNQQLKQELGYAHTRKDMEQNVSRLGDANVDDSLQQSGYFRD